MRITAAVVNERSGPFVVGEIDLCDPRDDELLVEVAASGMCATDLHGRDAYYPTKFPKVFGHEGARIVSALSGGVRLLTERNLPLDRPAVQVICDDRRPRRPDNVRLVRIQAPVCVIAFARRVAAGRIGRTAERSVFRPGRGRSLESARSASRCDNRPFSSGRRRSSRQLRIAAMRRNRAGEITRMFHGEIPPRAELPKNPM